MPLATSRPDTKRAVDKGKIVTRDGWLSLGQQNVFARGRVEGKSGGCEGGRGDFILLRMKFPLALIIPLKVGRLLFFWPGRCANKSWMNRVCEYEAG